MTVSSSVANQIVVFDVLPRTHCVCTQPEYKSLRRYTTFAERHSGHAGAPNRCIDNQLGTFRTNVVLADVKLGQRSVLGKVFIAISLQV
jgi:hypothetical protein